LKLEFDESLVPAVSKEKSEKEWTRFQHFLQSFGNEQEITMESIQGYLLLQVKKGYSPSTLRCRASMLKKMCVCKSVIVSDIIWSQVKSWLFNLNKNFKPFKSNVFSVDQIKKYVESFADPSPLELQKMALTVVAFSRGLRATEDYNILWKHVVIQKNDTGSLEVQITIPKTKGNPEGRFFIISSPSFVDIIVKYSKTFKSLAGFFFRCYNEKYKT